jgi:two-component system response regulator HydG
MQNPSQAIVGDFLSVKSLLLLLFIPDKYHYLCPHMQKHILIVEDDTAFGLMLQKWFQRNGFEVSYCSGVQAAYTVLKEKIIHIVLTDLQLPDGDGIMILQWIRSQKMDVPVIIMTGYGGIQSAVLAMKLGAFDYLEKPLAPSVLKEKIDQALAKEPEVKQVVRQLVLSDTMIMGTSIVAKQMYHQVLKVAPTRLSVMILGESGTGKEYIAKMIHQNSKRSAKPFIAVDCGSLSKELAPSEFFGHLKGSFTSAIHDKEGVFVTASGGTVFLDEIGNLPYDAQAQLLRTLQEQKVRPIGSTRDIPVDVRILAATNENLEQAINEGRFREDLYYRLNELSIFVPPLRERVEDIPIYANGFLKQANHEMDKNVRGFTSEAMQILERHSWRGNLRELRNTVRRIVLFANEDMIHADDLSMIQFEQSDSSDLALYPGNEAERIQKALQQVGGNKTLAAKLLKIDRKTLYNKMHLYGIKL